MKYVLIALIILMPFAAAECIVPDELLQSLDGMPLEGAARRVVGNDKTVVLGIDGNESWYRIEEWTAHAAEAGEADLRITTDACTASAIDSGELDPLTAYDEGKITVEAESFGSSVRLTVAKIGLGIYRLFN